MINSASESAGVGPDLKKAKRRTSPPQDLGRVDRLPPHAPEAEQGSLGCILLSPSECLSQCVEVFKGAGAEAYYDLRHQTIYTAMFEMWEAREPVDIITLQQRLKDKKLLDEVGGIPYLNALQDSVPSAANLTYYNDIVYEKWLLRRLVHTCSDVVGKVYAQSGNVSQLLDEVEREVMKLGSMRYLGDNSSAKALVHRSIAKIEKLFESKGAITGIPTGFPDLDYYLDGMQDGDMLVLAGYPSTGKTSLAVDIVIKAVLAGYPAAVFTCEMSPESLMMRAQCALAKVSLRNIKKGYMSEDDFAKLSAAGSRLSSAPIHIVETNGWSVERVKAKARRLHQEHNIRLFMVDYLQELKTDNKQAEKRSDTVAMVSNGLKALAMELRCPGLVLSQMNNDGGLFMSSETGMDADVVMKLRVDKTSSEWNSGAGVPVALDIDKQRNGPTGTVDLVFLRPYTTFESAAKEAEPDEYTR